MYVHALIGIHVHVHESDNPKSKIGMQHAPHDIQDTCAALGGT